MNILVLSTSLSPTSRSRILARAAMEEAQRLPGVTGVWLDLRELDLQFCDGRPLSRYNADMQRMAAAVASADGILMAFPVYNYTCSAAAKNVVEVAGEAFAVKRVGLLASAGGAMSYMAPQTLAQSLMLDFQTLVIPRYVYAIKAHFDGGVLTDHKIRDRIVRLVQAVAFDPDRPVE